MKEMFIEWNPNNLSKDMIDIANEIIYQYQQQGYSLTLRQLYYQFVSRDLLPQCWADKETGSTNNPRSYKNLGNIISKGRLAGLIDWESIEDRGRTAMAHSHWETPEEILRDAAAAYFVDHWIGQDYYLEVAVEKDSLSNVIHPVCSRWDVSFIANRGYSSLSAIYEMATRFATEIEERGKFGILLYLGDHDPSGIDMSRDVEDRTKLFLGEFRDCFKVDRIGLNIDQIRHYRPPENPAKITDSRSKNYIKEFGKSSWELDALEPRILEALVEENILNYLDVDRFNDIKEEMESSRKRILKFAKTFE